MPEVTLEEQIELALQSKNNDVRALALKIKRNWLEGVVPSAGDLARLRRLRQAPAACVRLQDDGRCDGWLRKYGPDSGVEAHPPFTCPFAGTAETPSKFIACPGYRTT